MPAVVNTLQLFRCEDCERRSWTPRSLGLLLFGAVFAGNNVGAVTGANEETRRSPCKVPWRPGYNVLLLFPHRRAVCVGPHRGTENPKVLKRIPFQAGRTAVDKFGIAHGRPSPGFLRRCRATLPSALCPCAVANDQGLFQDLGVVMGAASGLWLHVSFCLLSSSSCKKKGASHFVERTEVTLEKDGEKYSPHPPPILFPLLLLQTLAHARQRRGEGTWTGLRGSVDEHMGPVSSRFCFGIFRIFQRMKKDKR